MLMAVWKIWSAPVAREKRCNTSYIVSVIFSKAYCRDMRSGTSRWRALKKCSTSGDPSCASTMCPWKRRSPTLSSSFPRVWVLKSTNREDTSWLKHSFRGFGESELLKRCFQIVVWRVLVSVGPSGEFTILGEGLSFYAMLSLSWSLDGNFTYIHFQNLVNLFSRLALDSIGLIDWNVRAPKVCCYQKV